MWRYPWTAWGVLLASAGFLAGTVIGDIKHLFTLVLLAVSTPIYFLAVKTRPNRNSIPDIPVQPEAEGD